MQLLIESICPQACWCKAAALAFTDIAAFFPGGSHPFALVQIMQASKISYQLALVPMGEQQPPATLLRLGFSTRRVSLVLRQVHAALLPHVTLSAFQSSCSKSGGIKLLKGKECY